MCTCTEVVLIIAKFSRERMVIYGRTKTHLLVLCFILISYLIYLVGLHCIMAEDLTSLHVLFHLTTAEALIVSYAILFFLEKICLSGLLCVQAHEQFFFLVVGTVCEFASMLYFVFVGDLSIGFEMGHFSSAVFPATNLSVSSNQTVPMHPKFIFALAGTLLKGMSWMFIISLAMAKTFSFSHQETRMYRNKISNFYVSVRMVIFIAALYSSVVTWSVTVSNMFPDFIHSIYTMYLFYPYLISLSISECIDDSRVTIGVFLSIISVFMTLLAKNLLDLVWTIYLCSSHWTQQCTEQNPVYYSTVISNGVAGVLLWMCISKLWPLSDKNTLSLRDKPSDLHVSGLLALEEGYLRTSVV